MIEIYNKLTIYGPAVDAFIKAAQGLRQKYLNCVYLTQTLLQEFCFNQLLSLSKENLSLSSKEEAEKFEEKLWGCKEGAIDSEISIIDEQNVRYTFLTKDCICFSFIEKISEKFPGLNFVLSWASPDAINRGIAFYKNKKLIYLDQDDQNKFELKVPWETIENYSNRFNRWVYWYYENHNKFVEKTKFWGDIINYQKIDQNQAEYIIHGQGLNFKNELTDGILAYSKDKFTAYRIRKAIRRQLGENKFTAEIINKNKYLEQSASESENSGPDLVA